MQRSEKNTLAEIALATQRRVQDLLKQRSLLDWQKAAEASRCPWVFYDQFIKIDYPIISEIKWASPSEGKIYSGPLNAAEVAQSYLENGAAALSILTEPDFFAGHIDYLQTVRKSCPEARILMKDFILDPVQIYLARWIGADCILLIVAMLSDAQIKSLLKLATDLGLSVLVEVHNLEEMQRVLDLPLKMLGINNRNLKTLKTDLSTTETLVAYYAKNNLQKDVYLISESGLSQGSQLKMLMGQVDGFLIGSHFMKQAQNGLAHNPGLALRTMLEEARR